MIKQSSFLGQVFGFQRRRLRLWREIALLAGIMMELTWITPWFVALLGQAHAGSLIKAFLIFTLMALAVFLSTRLLSNLEIPSGARNGTLSLLLIVAVGQANQLLLHPNEGLSFLSSLLAIIEGFQSNASLLPLEFVLVFFLTLVWLRAVRWATSDALPSEMRGSLRFSFLMLVIYLLAFISRGQTALGYFPYLFFFFGLAAVGSARIARSEAHPATQISLFDRNWLVLLFGLFLFFSLLVGGLGLALGSSLEWFRQAALSLWLLFWGLVILVFSPLIVMVVAVFEWLVARVDLQALRTVFPGMGFTEQTDEVPEEGIVVAEEAGTSFLDALQAWLESLPIAEFLLAVRPYLFWVVILALITLGIFLAGRRVSLWKALGDNMDTQTSQEGEQWLLTLGHNWRKRLQGLRESVLRIANIDQGRKILAAARIRQVYSYLMDLSKSLGKERDIAITPTEFVDALEQLFPFHRKEIHLITNAYVRVRYGEIDESPNEVVEVDRAWLQLRLEGRRMKRDRRRKERQARRGEGANSEQTP